MPHNHESHDSLHGTELNSQRLLAHDARLASRINIGAGIIKTALGIFARSPVLVTDGVHDFGDADTYRSDALAIEEQDQAKKTERKIRAANKLGGYAIVGVVAELGSELLWKRPAYPLLSLVGGIGSVALNYFVHMRFAHHDHDDASEVKGHALKDLWTSGVTIATSIAAFIWPPAMILGSLAHVGIFGHEAWRVRKKFSTP